MQWVCWQSHDGTQHSKIRYRWRVKRLYLLQSCHRVAGCWKSPQKTLLHLVPRTNWWLGSHGMTKSKAGGQSCPIPVEVGDGLKGGKGFNTAPRGLEKHSNMAHLIFTVFSTWQYEVIDWIPVYLQNKSIMGLPLQRRKKEWKVLCQHNIHNFLLLKRSGRDLK